MKFAPVLLFLTCAFLTVLAEGDLFRARRHDVEIKNRNGERIRGKTGIPLFQEDKKADIRTGIPEHRFHEDVDNGGDSTLRDEDEEMDDSASETKDSDEDSGDSGDISDDDKDETDDEDDSDDKGKKNPEELGQGYEKIGDMGSKNKDDDESSDEDIMSKSAGKSGDSKGIPDLNGEFPPNADEAKNLPKDEELTPEQAERKMADKKKGYVQFTIREKFRPELKYKSSAAYKILSGNVREDVERALKATGVVRDVLFREAKDVGGPPYRSKVQVFLELKNVSAEKLKRIVDQGLINGMISVRGSFHA